MEKPNNEEIDSVLRVEGLELDFVAHTVKRNRRVIKLNRKEFALLEYFMRNVGKALTRIDILHNVWDMNADPFTNTVDVHVRFLRAKVDDPWKRKLIKTIHGIGYKIEGINQLPSAKLSRDPLVK